MRTGGHSRATVRVRAVLGLAAALLAAVLGVVDAGAEQAASLQAPPSPAAGPEPAASAAVQWKLIVHPANALRTVDRDELERIYRKRSRFWPDKSAILPLNLPGDDPIRRAFAAVILRDDEDELATFWNREYFQGVAPPAVLQSSRAVRAYVAATPNAIGYVTPEDVDSSVAVVEVTHAD